MTKEEVFKYMQDRVVRGQDTGKAAAAALDVFANTPQRALTLMRDVLGAGALQQWFNVQSKAYRDAVLCAEPETVVSAAAKKDRPAPPWQSRIDPDLIKDPGNILVDRKSVV